MFTLVKAMEMMSFMEKSKFGPLSSLFEGYNGDTSSVYNTMVTPAQCTIQW